MNLGTQHKRHVYVSEIFIDLAGVYPVLYKNIAYVAEKKAVSQSLGKN